jgi:hypothetical protein
MALVAARNRRHAASYLGTARQAVDVVGTVASSANNL